MWPVGTSIHRVPQKIAFKKDNLGLDLSLPCDSQVEMSD